MRLNFAHLFSLKQGKNRLHYSLSMHLVELCAQEFDVNLSVLKSQLHNCDSKLGEYLAEFLRSQGWHVTWYALPSYDTKSLSFGWVLNDVCENLIAWKLAREN